MKALSLFSGIGGFDIAFKRVIPNAEVIGFCEINPFCKEVLKKNFGKDIIIYEDITKLRKEQINGTVDVVYGGPPCQPASCAGKRKGTEDSRWLWGETLRLVEELKPKYCLFENPTGILSLQSGEPFRQIAAQMGNQGYELAMFIIPASAVGACHRRDRVWIVAHTRCEHGERGEDRGEPKRQIPCQKDASLLERPIGNDEQRIVADSIDKCCGKSQYGSKQKWTENIKKREGLLDSFIGEDSVIADTCNERLQRDEQPGTLEQRERPSRPVAERSWDENWYEVAAELCMLDDGVPRRMVRFPDGRTISRSKWRQEALKAYGNSIVPAVAELIFKAILSIDK